MTSQNEECSIVDLVINLLDGRTTPARAACGLPAPFLDLFCLTEKLGQLDRGASIELSPYECALLDQILDAACQNERLGKGPHRSAEVIAAMIKRVAFDNAPPEVWARNLYLGVIGGQSWSVRRQSVSIERSR